MVLSCCHVGLFATPRIVAPRSPLSVEFSRQEYWTGLPFPPPGEALLSQKKARPGADCDSDHQLHIAKFRLKLKKVGKATRPFKHGLN